MKLLSCSTNSFVSIEEKLTKEIDPADISPTQQVKQTESKFRIRKISSIKVFPDDIKISKVTPIIKSESQG